MAGEIKIDYQAVYGEIAELRAKLRNGIVRAEETVRQSQSVVEHMDGATNEELKAVLALQQQKTEIAVETIEKLLETIEIAALKVELKDARMAAIFGGNIGMTGGK